MPETQPLHLPDLYIEGFRGIDKLSIPRLGRVTLLAGKNSVGKTTVLDAIRVYAGRGRYSALRELLEGRDELSQDVDEDGDILLIPDISALFYGWSISKGSHIKIGPSKEYAQLRIGIASPDDLGEMSQNMLPAGFWDIDSIQVIKITFQGSTRVIPWGVYPRMRRPQRRSSIDTESPHSVKCESLGPGVLTNQDLARFWDNVALTDDEESAIESLRSIFGKTIDGLVAVGDHTPIVSPFLRNGGRKVMVKLASHSRPVPLRSLGDGASRMLGVSIALANSQNGFLLLDEAENGIHYSLQHTFWSAILQAALKNNVQVIATTHSWDCVVGFARAAIECEDAEGILYRLSRRYGDLRAVEYPESELKIAADQYIEVR